MATADAIKQALSQLDHTNDEHWTDDGLPRTSTVQKLANDPEIRRPDIQAVAPTFMRKTGDAQPAPVVETARDLEDAPATADVTAPDDLKAAARKRVSDAEVAVAAARNGIDTARKVERAATKELDNARLDLAREFPPLSEAENLKQHIQHETEMRAQRVRAIGPQQIVGKDNIDIAMNARQPSRGRRSEYARPNRAPMGVAQ